MGHMQGVEKDEFGSLLAYQQAFPFGGLLHLLVDDRGLESLHLARGEIAQY